MNIILNEPEPTNFKIGDLIEAKPYFHSSRLYIVLNISDNKCVGDVYEVTRAVLEKIIGWMILDCIRVLMWEIVSEALNWTAKPGYRGKT